MTKPDDQPDALADADIARFDEIPQQAQRVREQLAKVVVGQDRLINTLLAAVFSQGHVLIVGAPGLAKTLLVRTLADCIALKFRRIQFTPDMMPSDIVGTELIQEDPQTGERSMKFVAGPVFAQLLLADEINRTPPKTQAALLEAMAERQVTVAGRTMPLEQPFLVVATQNPIEQEGAYPLPEAQLDRFMFSLWIDYPSRDEELTIVAEAPRIRHAKVDAVLTGDEILAAAALIERMPVSAPVVAYAVDLVRATRPPHAGQSGQTDQTPHATRSYVSWGAGPRAAQHLLQAAKALAAMDGRPTPSCQDVQAAAPPVLGHRLVLNYAATGDGVTAADVLLRVIESTPTPA